MIFRKKIQKPTTEQMKEEHQKADAQIVAARRELTLARAMGSDLRRIRQENNFMNDFRAALGGGSN